MYIKKNMKNKKLAFILSLFMILAMLLQGCSHNNESSEPDTAVTNTVTGKTDATVTGTAADITDTGAAATGAVTDITDAAVPDTVTDETGAPSDEGAGSATVPATEYDKPKDDESDDVVASFGARPSSDIDTATRTDLAAAADSISMDDGFYTYESAMESPAMEPAPFIDSSVSSDFPLPEADTAMPESFMETKPEYIDPSYEQPTAGLLTAAEWNDNKNPDFLRELIANGQDYTYSDFFTEWGFAPFKKINVHCFAGSDNANGAANIENAAIKVYDSLGNLIYSSRTDVNGAAYLYYNNSALYRDSVPAKIEAVFNGETLTKEIAAGDLQDDAVVEFAFSAQNTAAKALDLMFVVDTTGSMMDEIRFLQAELSDVINKVRINNNNLPIRLSVNFYRDHGDDYVVRSYEFSDDINEQLAYLNREYAFGGGDYEEAVEEALADAIDNHTWKDDSTKLLFIVLDAPPHNTPGICDSLAGIIDRASEKGIRIIPVASSGVDKSTEFLLRTLAMTTGGTYTFLTDDSGIGGGHIEASIGEHTVEYLNNLLIRIIDSYLGVIDEIIPYVPAQVNYPEPYIDYDIDDSDIYDYPIADYYTDGFGSK